MIKVRYNYLQTFNKMSKEEIKQWYSMMYQEFGWADVEPFSKTINHILKTEQFIPNISTINKRLKYENVKFYKKVIKNSKLDEETKNKYIDFILTNNTINKQIMETIHKKIELSENNAKQIEEKKEICYKENNVDTKTKKEIEMLLNSIKGGKNGKYNTKK